MEMKKEHWHGQISTLKNPPIEQFQLLRDDICSPKSQNQHDEAHSKLLTHHCADIKAGICQLPVKNCNK